MQRQQIILLSIGIVLALAAVFMVYTYINQQRQIIMEEVKKKIAQAAPAQTIQAAVLVAKKDIPPGMPINVEMLEAAVIPNSQLQPNAVTSLDRIAETVAITAISKGEQITLSKLAPRPPQAKEGVLSQITPVGKRAVTISVDNIASLAGMIRPGDYVDVIVMLPIPVQTPEGKQTTQTAVIPLFQNVLVLAVGQDIVAVSQAGSQRPKKEEKREASPLITLALGLQEVNLMAFVQEQGKIRLSLRSPADSQIQIIQPAGWEALFKYLPQQTPEKEAKDGSLPFGYVEIYRGANKERVPLSK